MTNALKTARAEVNRHEFGSAEWEAAMQVVRSLVAQVGSPAEEFCSVDSGLHRTRLLDGRTI